MDRGKRCGSCLKHTQNYRDFHGYVLCRKCYREIMEMTRATGEGVVLGELSYEIELNAKLAHSA